MMRGLSSALKKTVRGERKAGAHSRFSPGCRREAERTAAAGLQSFHRTSPDAHSAHRRISRTPEYRSPARRLICAHLRMDHPAADPAKALPTISLGLVCAARGKIHKAGFDFAGAKR